MKDNKIAFWLIIIVIIIIAIAVGLYAYALSTKPQLLDVTINNESQSFIVTGRRLAKVDVMVVPTGTTIKESDHQILTSMNLTTGDQNDQIWSAHVPTTQFLATSIYVKAYDSQDTVIGTKTLPYSGATEIYNVFSPFWTTTPAVSTTTSPR